MRTLPVALIALTLAGGITGAVTAQIGEGGMGGVRARGSGLQQRPPLWANISPSDIIYDFDDPLKGLSEVSIFIEPLDSDAEECGIREEALRLAAARPLLDGGIRVVDEIPSADIHVAVIVVPTGPGGCAGFLSVSLRDYVRATLRHKNEVAPPNTLVLTYTSVVYKSSGKIFTGPKLNFGDRIMADVRETVDSIVTKIKLANQE